MQFARTRMLVGAAALVALMVPAIAGAQPGPTAGPTPRDQSFTFGDQLVQASLRVPEGATARGRLPRSGGSLIRHRAHFVPEMLRSVEHL